MASEPSIVARRIKEIREAKRLSRQALADRLNIIAREARLDRETTYLQIYRIETGVTEVRADAVPEFASALDVSVAALYRESKAS